MIEPIRDLPHIDHMLDAIDNALEFSQGKTREEFLGDKVLLHATVYNIQIIGEAVSRLTKEFRQRYPEVPWLQIEKMRHILVHDYYKVNMDFIWLVITDDLLPLREKLLSIKESES